MNIAKACPDLGVGVHLTLVGERPLCALQQVASLVGGDGRLPDTYGAFLLRFVTGRIKMTEIERELRAQIERVLASGIAPSHFDSHQHLHAFPVIAQLVARLAAEYNVARVRVPCEPTSVSDRSIGAMRHWARSGLSAVARYSSAAYRKRGVRSTDNFYGMLYGGCMTSARLQGILAALPEGTSEIMMHPAVDGQALSAIYGWQYHWQEELHALSDIAVRNCMQRNEIELISFNNI